MHIRKDDVVEVLTGDDRGEPGNRRVAKILRVIPDSNKVVVEGVNRVYKHMKPSAKNQQGGRLSKEMPIAASNVLLYCNACGRGVRTGRRIDAAGRKERYCKACSAGLGAVGPAKTARATKKK